MDRRHPVFVFLITLLGYWSLGKLAGVFAIPPGYASPIWPAAGFALLMIFLRGPSVLPAIGLASFLLNIGFAGASLLEPSPAWIVAAIIACGAMAQTWVARWLIVRFTGYPQWRNLADPAWFMILGGPVACLTASVVGVGTLTAFGVVPASEALANWLNWWIGDAIGVVCMAPLVIALTGQAQWSATTRLTSFIVLYVALIGLATTSFLYFRTQNTEWVEELFAERVASMQESVDRQLYNIEHVNLTMVGVFLNFDVVSVFQFRQFAQELLDHTAGAHALSWIPLVTRAQRPTYEARMSQWMGVDKTFWQRDDAGAMIPAADRDRYFPVYYIAPLVGNERAQAFDLGSHPGRLAAIEQALERGTTMATEPITLVQETQQQRAFLLLTPILRNGRPTGLISSVYRAVDLLNAAFNITDLEQISVSMLDVTHDTQRTLFYESSVEPTEHRIVHRVPFAGRQWEITYSPGKAYLKNTMGYASWLVLVAQFLIVSLIGMFLLVLMNQKSAVENAVQEQTKALKLALSNAERASQVKSNFLASMSHELRTPLNSVIGFSVRAQKKLVGTEHQRVLESLGLIERNGRHLLGLINDVLDLSKVEAGKLTITKTQVPIEELVVDVLDLLRPLAEERGLQLDWRPGEVYSVPADRKRLSQILINLVSNAIKFTQQGTITLQAAHATHDGHAGVALMVEDTGIGIEAEDLRRLFRRFEQLGNQFTNQDLGSGLGLALVQELVTLHGGRVDVTSEPDKGTVFTVWLPRDQIFRDGGGQA